MKRILQLFICFLFALILLNSCKVFKNNRKDQYIHQDLSQLDIPKEFLPQAGKCHVLYPESTLTDKPSIHSCNSRFLENSHNKSMIKNEGTNNLPVYRVTQFIKAEVGFSIFVNYYSNRVAE